MDCCAVSAQRPSVYALTARLESIRTDSFALEQAANADYRIAAIKQERERLLKALKLIDESERVLIERPAALQRTTSSEVRASWYR